MWICRWMSEVAAAVVGWVGEWEIYVPRLPLHGYSSDLSS